MYFGIELTDFEKKFAFNKRSQKTKPESSFILFSH